MPRSQSRMLTEQQRIYSLVPYDRMNLIIDDTALTSETVFIPLLVFQISNLDARIHCRPTVYCSICSLLCRKELSCIHSLHESRSHQTQGKRKEINGQERRSKKHQTSSMGSAMKEIIVNDQSMLSYREYISWSIQKKCSSNKQEQKIIQHKHKRREREGNENTERWLDDFLLSDDDDDGDGQSSAARCHNGTKYE